MIILPLFLAALTIASPSASPSVIPTETQLGGSEIQKFREIIQEKVKAKLQEISQPVNTDSKRGFFGTITKIDDKSINLDTKEKNHNISYSAETTIVNNKSIKIKSAELKVGQEILVIGLLDEQNLLTAKRIIVTVPKTSTNLKTTIFGQIVDVSSMYSLFALIPTNNKNTQYQVKTDTKNILIVSKDGTKLTTKDIVKGKKVIVVSTQSPISSQTLSAEKIIVM